MLQAASSASSCPSQLSAELRVNQTADRTAGEGDSLAKGGGFLYNYNIM
jgi:hypothetical protein